MMASTFSDFFIKSAEELTQGILIETVPSIPIDNAKPVFEIKKISELEVKKIITSLRNLKAKDSYGLDTTFLKSHRDALACPIAHLINLSIRQSTFPNTWKIAEVSPIRKFGDKTMVSNYSPISVLSVISKVSEKWVAEQLKSCLNFGHDPLHPMQFGFRTNHYTETANCFFLENIKSKLDGGGVVGAVFLDLKKAFDTVNL